MIRAPSDKLKKKKKMQRVKRDERSDWKSKVEVKESRENLTLPRTNNLKKEKNKKKTRVRRNKKKKTNVFEKERRCAVLTKRGER